MKNARTKSVQTNARASGAVGGYVDKWLSDDGRIHLFLTAASPMWQARIKLPSKRVKRESTKERKLERAKDWAKDKLREAEMRHGYGLEDESVSFKRAAEEYLLELDRQLQRGERTAQRVKECKGTVDRYLVPFFKDKALEMIKTKHIEAYKSWRKDYWTSGPGAQNGTIPYWRDGKEVRMKPRHKGKVTYKSGELTPLREILNLAVERGWLASGAKPAVTPFKNKTAGKARPGFTAEEVSKLLGRIEKWTDDGDKQPNHVIWEWRRLTRDLVGVMMYSGMRPGEAWNLKWRNIRWVRAEDKPDGELLHVEIDLERGKTGKRHIVAQPEIGMYLGNRERVQLTDRQFVDEYVFGRDDGREPGPLPSHAFNRFLEWAKLELDATGSKRTLYSLRHAYITLALLNELDVHLISRNCGTGISMIEKHYSHVVPRMRSEKLARAIG